MLFGRVAVVLAIGVGTVTCALPAAHAKTLTFGVIGSMTGAAAQYGLAAKEAFKICAEQVNAKGGLNVGGQHYDLKIAAYDDQQKPSQAVAAYQRLTTIDGARYIFVQNSPSTMAIKRSVESDKTLMLTAAFSPNAIDANTKYTIRIYMNGDNISPAFAKWLAAHLKERRIAMLNQNDETGWGFSKTMGKYYKQSGFTVVANELYERSLNDFSPLLTKVLADKPDLIDVGVTTPGTAGLIARQARELGYKGRFLQSGGGGWDAIVAAAGKKAAEGMITVLYADPENAAYAKIVAAYEKDVGQAPNAVLAPFYDSCTVLVRAIELAGDAKNTTKVDAAFAKALPMKSLQGDTLKWGHQQILNVDYIAEIKDGKPTIIGKIQGE